MMEFSSNHSSEESLPLIQYNQNHSNQIEHASSGRKLIIAGLLILFTSSVVAISFLDPYHMQTKVHKTSEAVRMIGDTFSSISRVYMS